LQDNEGPAFVGSNNTVTTTDFGAISGAADISQSALDLVRHSLGDILDTGERIANGGLENAQSAYAGSLDFASDIAKSAFDAYEGSADKVSKFAGDSIDRVAGFADRTLDAKCDRHGSRH
jgi:hypothetical protein